MRHWVGSGPKDNYGSGLCVSLVGDRAGDCIDSRLDLGVVRGTVYRCISELPYRRVEFGRDWDNPSGNRRGSDRDVTFTAASWVISAERQFGAGSKDASVASAAPEQPQI